MRNTKSIPGGIKYLILKTDEPKLAKIKTLVSNFRQTANSNLPLYPNFETFDKNETIYQDMLRHEYFSHLSSKTQSESQSRFLRERQSLYYITKAAQDKLAKNEVEQTKKIYNIADELNKKYKIKKVEASIKLKRTGLLGYKIGMTGIWDKFGTWHPLTVIKIDRCQVIAHKADEKKGYYAMEVGCGEKRVKNTRRPLLGHFIKHGVPPKKDIKEFRVNKENLLPSGYVLTVRHFVPGQFVDVQGISKGHGWAGVMKRWNFKGGSASHGNSLTHRAAVIFK
jgi:50S ribosomal protein uL3